MATTNEFKVIIAGGGIAGLALANMLERFGLPYLVLEAHSAIAPPVGASIGLFPNGLRILDQIGCYEQIRRVSDRNLDVSHIRDQNGNIIYSVPLICDHLERRHGYAMHFFDRQSFLQILYDHVQHKDRILLNKKVKSIDLIDGGVNVTTGDGSVFTGTLVVGADGIHSTVRAAMTALGNKAQPGYFPPGEEEHVPCYYRCSFGIAQHVPGWIAGEQNIVIGEGRSQLVISGPEDRVYWFMFEKLPETRYGSDIPKYTKKDEAEFIKQNFNRPITTEVTFGQVFSKRLSSTLTPLHEVVYTKWFFKRIITLGDSAHKPNPIGGQGANGALESCAELVNAILRKKDCRDGRLTGLTDQDLEDIFTETQAARHERAEMIIHSSHKMQALNAYESPLLSTAILELLQPFVGHELTLTQLGSLFGGGSVLSKIDVPRRPRIIPFDNECPAKPVGKETSKLARYAYIGCGTLALFATTKGWRLPLPHLGTWGEAGPSADSSVLSIINNSTSSLSMTAFKKEASSRIQLINSLSRLISPLLIYTIEGYRLGNRGTPLYMPSLYSIIIQLQGIGRTALLHAALSAFCQNGETTGRSVDPKVANSLIPALSIGYVLPAMMVVAQTPNVKAWPRWVLLWQFAPTLFSALVAVFSAGLKRWSPGHKAEKQSRYEGEFDCYRKNDVPILKSVYMCAFAVQAAAHLAALASSWTDPNFSLNTFMLPDPAEAGWGLSSMKRQIDTSFRYDMALAVVSYMCNNLYSIWDMRRLGYIKTREAIQTALGVVAGQFLVGPGATWAALWHWREDKIANVSRERLASPEHD